MKQLLTFILAFAVTCNLSGQTPPSTQKNSKQHKNRTEEKKQKRTAVAYDVADIVLAKKIIIHMESALLSQPIIPVPLSENYASFKLVDNRITCALPKISTYQIAKFMYGTSPEGISDKYTIYANNLPVDEMKVAYDERKQGFKISFSFHSGQDVYPFAIDCLMYIYIDGKVLLTVQKGEHKYEGYLDIPAITAIYNVKDARNTATL